MTRLFDTLWLSALLLGCPSGGDLLDGGPVGDAPFDAAATDCGPCDDFVPCTDDRCEAGAFVHEPNDTRCDDGDWCNGAELCDAVAGCTAAPRGPCDDGDVCTVGLCDPATESCEQVPRDLDGDGSVDHRCGGTDCDDLDDTVPAGEACEDDKDNDCDGDVDETDCAPAAFDTCDDPLDVSAGGTFSLGVARAPDHASTCGVPSHGDSVAVLTLAEPRSVALEVIGDGVSAIELRTDCATPGSALGCERGLPATLGHRALDPGTYFVIVTAAEGPLELRVTLDAPVSPVPNDTCAAPLDVSAGGSFAEWTAEVGDELDASCGGLENADLVYAFTLTERQNVTLAATGDAGIASLSLRTACGEASSELRCVRGPAPRVVSYDLAPGTYFAVLESRRLGDVTLDVSVDPPTLPPPGETCANPLPLTAGSTPVSLGGAANDHRLECTTGDTELVYRLTLTESSDVDVSVGGGAYVGLSLRAVCADSGSALGCVQRTSPRLSARSLPAGDYYLLVESASATTFDLEVDVGPPRPIVDVAGNDTCASAHVIDPVAGGLYRGDTRINTDAVSTGLCASGTSSPDAVFALTLAAPTRVRMSTSGSAFDTVLHVQESSCTSSGGFLCDDDGGPGSTSLIDMPLRADTYFIIVDGWGAANSGEYLLEVELSDP